MCECCDRYDMLEGKYYKNVCENSLRYLVEAHLPFYSDVSIATDEEEKFAILVFCNKGSKVYDKQIIVMFTEDKGFVHLSNLES